MRLERMTAIVVLAAGLMAVGAVSAAPQETAPPAAQPPDAAPVDKTAQIPRGPKAPMATTAPTVPKPQPVGNEHKILGALAGHWKAKMHPVPDGATKPAPDTEGTAEGKLVMGGRFAEVSHQGLLNGQPFEGMMLLGFDNVINRYTSAWVDNTTNGIVHFVGTFDAAKKQLTMTAHYSDPATRRLTLSKVVLTFVDANSWLYDEYIAHAVGEKETHTMSIKFTRG